jgi:hypothetical protein
MDIKKSENLSLFQNGPIHFCSLLLSKGRAGFGEKIRSPLKNLALTFDRSKLQK